MGQIEWVPVLETMVADLADTGWVAGKAARSCGPALEWELVRAGPPGPRSAPIENFLVRYLPTAGLLLFFHGNTDAGAFNFSMVAPLARVIDLPAVETTPVVPGGLAAVLRRLIRDCEPNRYGLT